MAETPAHDVTQLLQAWSEGEERALDKLMPLVYRELHRLAQRYMAHERPGHTLQTTALVNEAYLRLVDAGKVNFQNRAHFFAVSAQLMRRILVEFARRHGSQKRGGEVRIWWRLTTLSRLWPPSTPEEAGWWSCAFLAG
jgi:RNA polymerase sigma factor (TIGR02999 family)